MLQMCVSQANLLLHQHIAWTPVATLQDASTMHPSAMPTLPLPAIAAGAKAKSAKRPSLARTLSLDRTAGSKLEPGAGLVRNAEQLDPCRQRQGLRRPVHTPFPVQYCCLLPREAAGMS